MVPLAWIYESVWALAVGGVAGAIVTTVLSHAILPSHGHKFRIEKEALNTLIHFGKWIFLTTVFGYLGGMGLRAIQGLLVTPTDLGIIYIASSLAWAVGELTKRLTVIVGFPVLSQIARDEPDRLRAMLAKIRLRLFALAFPVFFVMAFLSSFIMDTLYDERYAAGGNYLAIMALTGAMAILTMGYAQVFLSIGDSRTHFFFVAIHSMLRAGGMLAGYQISGIEGMFIGIGIANLFSFFFVVFLSRKSGWLSPLLDMAAITIILLASIVVYFMHFAPPG